MLVYFGMIVLWAMHYPLMVSERKDEKSQASGKRWFFIYASLILTLVMGLKKWTVGCDWVQYLYTYNLLVPDLSNEAILESGRAGFFYLLRLFHMIGLSDQGFILIVGWILSFGFGYFFYKYSDNMLLSFYLHITIGMFTMSMSGIRQSIAVVITLFSFIYMTRGKYIRAIILITLAASFHRSALVFLVVIPFMHLSIDFSSGLGLWIAASSLIPFRRHIAPVVAFLSPREYLDRYSMLSDSYRINPLLIMIAFAIPLACLISHEYLIKDTDSDNDKYFSILYIMSMLNALSSIMSLNSNIIGRIGFYFTTFNIVLLTNCVVQIKDRTNRTFAIMAALILPMIQFILATPGGTLRIDNYQFFWQ